MNFYHPYYIKEIHADRERQIKKLLLLNDARQAAAERTASKKGAARPLGSGRFGLLRRRPTTAK